MSALRGVAGLIGSLVVGCGADGPALSDFYPALPPTGGPRTTVAGAITAADTAELLSGPGARGQVGDFFMRNDQLRVVIGAPTRVIGVIPQGGNLIDAAPIGSDGRQRHDDHFGELSMLYKAGRTCEHTSMEVVRDGADGGAAVLRAVGRSGLNEFVNLKGMGVLPISDDLDADVPDQLECATTYILHPGVPRLEVHWSLFNAGSTRLLGPFGMLNDSGGETESFSSGRGFERAGLEVLGSLTTPMPIDYVVYQGPGPAYGVVPRFDTPTPSTAVNVRGVSIVLFGADNLFDLFDVATYALRLEPAGGRRQRLDVVIGDDSEDTDAWLRQTRGEPLRAVGGVVRWSSGEPAPGARVGIYADADGNGAIDDTDPIVSYVDAGPGGRYAAQVPATGALLVRAEVKNQARSPAVGPGAEVALTLPTPVRLDYQVLDDATGEPIPARVLVLGTNAAFPDKRVFETFDRLDGVVTHRHAIHGSSTGALADPPLWLPAGTAYRVYASRGTEWTIASQPFAATASGTVTLRLRRVVDTSGYLAAEFHVHQVGSLDSPVGSIERVRSAVSAGIELFAVTDHDVVSDLQPFVEALGLDEQVRVMPGLEVTPFAYGHFNAYPINPEPGASGGAIDWGRGRAGYSMTPAEIFDGARARGARVAQVNHPRGADALGQFQQFFDRANLAFDYDARTIYGDFPSMSVPASWLRLPEESLWTDRWNALEVWNGFELADTDGDGRAEVTSLDRVLRDWFNLLSLGFYVAPVGNSDTHTSVAEPVGMPRTLVRVTDDTGRALASGAAVDEVLTTIEGVTAARDLIVTNGPMLAVTAGGMPAIGRQVTAQGGTVTLVVTATGAAWADIDTLEVFANDTPATPVARPGQPVSVTPLKCWTSRPLAGLAASDPCVRAPIAPEAMTIERLSTGTGGGFHAWRAQVTITLSADDVRTRAGATGRDAWLVVRVRGDVGIFPMLTLGVVDADTLPVLVGGTDLEVAAVMRGRGVPAIAFAAPVFLDFDGGGYRAPFQP